jgi:hypothetical protein
VEAIMLFRRGRGLPIPDDLERNLLILAKYLAAEVGDDLLSINLYGSWSWGRGNAESDVDVGLIVRSDAPWVRTLPGVVRRVWSRWYWRDLLALEARARAYIGDGRAYEIRKLTPRMPSFYRKHGPVYAVNWVTAISGGVRLWPTPDDSAERSLERRESV